MQTRGGAGRNILPLSLPQPQIPNPKSKRCRNHGPAPCLSKRNFLDAMPPLPATATSTGQLPTLTFRLLVLVLTINITLSFNLNTSLNRHKPNHYIERNPDSYFRCKKCTRYRGPVPCGLAQPCTSKMEVSFPTGRSVGTSFKSNASFCTKRHQGSLYKSSPRPHTASRLTHTLHAHAKRMSESDRIHIYTSDKPRIHIAMLPHIYTDTSTRQYTHIHTRNPCMTHHTAIHTHIYTVTGTRTHFFAAAHQRLKKPPVNTHKQNKSKVQA